ncbi:MAG: PDZ domain-containing protein [Mariniblastus sp.]|nr:PDZ domain-containing protein [Mariniblastus sp.]
MTSIFRLLTTYSVLLLVSAYASQLFALDLTRMVSDGAVSQSNIAFVYDGDLWIAQIDGSHPRRLTSHEGLETSPRFSPDGQSIAFSAEYDGNRDVYLIPISGGVPRRLTFHPSPDNVEGFTPDGKSVLFSTNRNLHTRRYHRLYTVPVEGGFPKSLPIPNGLRASYSPDGSQVAYIPIAERFNQWKNYRGGTCSRIWIFNNRDYSVQQIPQPEGRCNDTDPVFVGSQVFFRSDRNGEFNLFSYDPQSGAMRQWTDYTDFPINRITESADSIIYEQAGLLHLFQPANGETNVIPLSLTTDQTEIRPRFVTGKKWIRNLDVSPSGKRAVAEFRGEIVTLPAKKGDVRNLTESPGVHERSPAWSPDGSKIAYFSDADGEYKLHIARQDGKGDVQVFEVEGAGFYEAPRWSPDGSRISYRDNSWSLYVFELASGASTKICSEPKFGPAGMRGLHHSWSPDSQWLAYTVNTPAMIQQAFVYHVASGQSFPVSDGMSEVSEPVFDRNGKYLYFISSTDAGPVKHWFAMSNNDMELSNAIYLVVLEDDGPNPLARQSDEEEAKAEPDKTKGKAGQEGAKPGQVPTVKIDFDGLDQRILALPTPAARYSNLRAGPGGTLLFIKRDREGDSELASFSLESRETTTLLDKASRFVVTPDGKKLLYVTSGGYGIAPTQGKIDVAKTGLNVEAIEVRIDPRAEWKQIFNEVWRINRDYFYDPGMHGCDWVAMKSKYEPLVDQCVTRSDLNRVLMWMCSELAVGHHRVGGGQQRLEADSVAGGLLGADYEIVNNRYRFKKVFGGLNWNGQLRAPLTEPGVRVRPGEYLLAVQGAPLTAEDNLHRHFENTSGKIVELRVGPNPDGSDSRIVKVVPVGNESQLRNRDWVEGNLRKVHQATGGRVAYVYVPNTTGAGHTYFKRYFFPQTDKQAIIVDERYNGGGQIADYYIDHLRRPYISHWATRYGQDLVTPSASIAGPKVMLIDETAGSGGDMLPWMFNKLKLGTLVGRRTWGGLVGVLGFPVLMDGGTVSAPNLAIWTEDGFIVENAGVPPDVEVEQLPADVIAGRDPQLEKAIEIALQQLEANPPKQYRKPPYPIRVRK